MLPTTGRACGTCRKPRSFCRVPGPSWGGIGRLDRRGRSPHRGRLVLTRCYDRTECRLRTGTRTSIGLSRATCEHSQTADLLLITNCPSADKKSQLRFM